LTYNLQNILIHSNDDIAIENEFYENRQLRKRIFPKGEDLPEFKFMVSISIIIATIMI
jgi:hypothetical protein